MKKNHSTKNFIMQLCSTLTQTNKTQNRFSRLFPVVFMLALTLTQCLTAQYTTLYNFLTEGDNNMRNPFSSELLINGTVLYGMTPNGGNNNGGVIFKINNDGTAYQKLHDFAKKTGSSPYGSLTLIDDSLCGMTYYGGKSDSGVIFKMNINGTGYHCLYNFNKGYPRGNLIQVGDSLYGMTQYDGTDNRGNIFKIHKYGKGYKTIFNFTGTSTGSSPYGSLTLVGDSLYGMTPYGGVNNVGAIFKIHRNGSGFKKIYDLSTTSGSYPMGSLTLVGDSLYGMSNSGGVNTYGTIFKIHKNSSGFQKLIDFSSISGFNPFGSLTLTGDSLYGTTYYENYYYSGAIFKINKNGSGFQKILTFNGAEKGANPRGSLTLSGTMLYGMTQYGGTNNSGVIFKIGKDGTEFTKLKDCYQMPDGSTPNDVITDGSYIYGTTYEGGAYGLGVIFKTNSDGSGFQQIHDFNRTNGAYPKGPLTLVADSLYGTTYIGGTSGQGALFKININGNGYQRMFSFSSSNGSYPQGSLTMVADSLYGMTYQGGVNGYGVIFKIHKNGSGYKTQYSFNNTNGRYPYGSLTLVGDSLYGMTRNGGTADLGVIFKIHRNGSGLKKIFDFTVSSGVAPEGSLTLSGDSLYGMTSSSINYGLIFKIHRNGSGYKKMHEFEALDGIIPRGSLTLLGDALYGLTSSGASNGYGSIFRINFKTGLFDKLFDLDAQTGSKAQGSLFLSNNSFYGTCSQGGTNGMGVVFKFKPVTVQTTSIQFSNVLATQMDISFTIGDGDYRAVFMKQGNTGTPTPTNNTNYTANNVFASGAQAGTGWYCVANSSLNTVTVKGLTANTTYRVMVVEYNGVSGKENYMTSAAIGNPANQTTINKLNQTISFGSIPVKAYGSADFSPASASSGLAVAYSSSNTGVATIVNGMIHIVGLGTSTITASQDGNGNYNAATPVNQNLTVTKGNQTITFSAIQVKSPGDADFDPSATTSSGLTVSYSSSNTSVAAIVGGLIHILGAGTSNITASQAGNSNFYAATDVVQVLTVKSAQTITFPAIPKKKQGDADFNSGATASSGLPVTYTSSNTNVATVAGGLIHIVSAGTSNITASQAGNSSYNAAADVVQVLTVNKGTLVNDLGEPGIEIYPVPASDKLYIKIPANKTAIVQMVNIRGQVVVNQKLTNQIGIIDVSMLAKGIYALKLVIDDKVIVKKIEVQ
jgi:uncharacterized repeat protein (TIGR03803 family)